MASTEGSQKLQPIRISATVLIVLLLLASCVPTAVARGSATLSDRPDKQQIRTDLAEILSDPRYAEDESFPVMLWLLDRIIGPVIEFLSSVFGDRAQSLLERSPIVYWSMVGVLAALAVGIVVHLLFALISAFREPSRKAAEGGETVIEAAPPDRLQVAKDAAARGDYGRATILMYLAILHELDSQERIRFSDSETNRRMVRQLEQTDLRAALMDITGTVDAIIYGGRSVGQDTYTQMRRIAAEVGV